jgi:hypothetical protein
VPPSARLLIEIGVPQSKVFAILFPALQSTVELFVRELEPVAKDPVTLAVPTTCNFAFVV